LQYGTECYTDVHDDQNVEMLSYTALFPILIFCRSIQTFNSGPCGER